MFPFLPFRCASPLTNSTVANSRRHSPTTITDRPQARKGITTQTRHTLLRMRRRVLPPNTPQGHPGTVEVTEAGPSGAASSPPAGVSEVASRAHNGTPRATTAEASLGRLRVRILLMPRPIILPVAMLKLRPRKVTSRWQTAIIRSGPPKTCRLRTPARRNSPRKRGRHPRADHLRLGRNPRRLISLVLV